jgi:hypothetical protein
MVIGMPMAWLTFISTAMRVRRFCTLRTLTSTDMEYDGERLLSV